MVKANFTDTRLAAEARQSLSDAITGNQEVKAALEQAGISEKFDYLDVGSESVTANIAAQGGAREING